MRLHVLFVLCVLAALPRCHAAPAVGKGYPRIANLWGGSPAATNYDYWARHDLLVMGGGAPGQWRTFRQEMRKRGSGVKLLGTAPLMNLGPPEASPWMQDTWFLRRPGGEKIRWWADQIYTPNLLIDHCLAALVEQTEKPYGDLLRGGALDGVFYDSVVGYASWLGEVDTNGDGAADRPEDVDPQWLQRQCLFLDRVRASHPGVLLLANDVDDRHAPHVNGRLFEGGPLLDQVTNGTLAPGDAIKTLNTWMAGSVQPGITFAIMTHPLGWQGWRVGKGNAVTTPGEVDRVRRDFARMRLGLLTTLMTDAYYAYDVGTVWYGLPLWYAEYDAPLGEPLGPAREVGDVPPAPICDWHAGQPTTGLVLDSASRATPAGIEGAVGDPQSGWCRLFATDPRRVPFEPGKSYRIEAELEVSRHPTGTLQFNLRTAKGGWEHHDKGIRHNTGKAGDTWRVEVTVVPDDFDDYAAEWHLNGAGSLRLKRLRVLRLSDSYFLREFQGGVALLNTTPRALTLALKRPMRRLADKAAPRQVVEVDDGGAGFAARGAWEALGGESHFYGAGYRAARKPGETARWSFTAPSTDTYSLFTCVPGGKHLTPAAEYTVRCRQGLQARTLDQRKGDGGWTPLFRVKLAQGERCEVTLRSAGQGATAADAIRAESTARYNDGALMRRLTLAPLDGTILLNAPERRP